MAKKTVSCPVETAIKVMGGRWKVLVLHELFGGVKRFSELSQKLAGVSHRTLTQQLRELESDGIIRRKVYRQVPPKVEYSLTPIGETLKPVLDQLHAWSIQYDAMQKTRSSRQRTKKLRQAQLQEET